MPTATPIDAIEPSFAERWVVGTYVVSGMFVFNGNGVTPSDILEAVDPLFRQVRAHQRKRWPRGLAGYFLIPIYCGAAFPSETCEWVKSRHAIRWAIWLEPILYDTSGNQVMLREDYKLFGSAFFPYLNQLFVDGLVRVAKHFGHEVPPKRRNA